MEDKQIRSQKMYKISLLVILGLLSVMILFINARLNSVEMDIGVLNKNLEIIDEDIITVNDNILLTNENIAILQDNLYYVMNQTCS